MNRFVSFSIGIFIILFLTSCSVKHTPTTFTQLPSVTIHGDEAWDILLDTVSNYYPGIEIANKETGHIRSIGTITDTCWAGVLHGGMVPCEVERFVAKVVQFSPFEVNIAIEKRKATTMSNYRQWYAAGNDIRKEQVIYNHLIRNLNAKFKPPVEKNNSKNIIIEMPSYSFTVEKHSGWDVKRGDARFEKIIITKKESSIEYKIVLMKNLVIDKKLQYKSSSYLADEYRNVELKNMEELGVKQGIYQLENIIKKRELIGNKEFYMLGYDQTSSVGMQHNNMYLYFPPSKKTEFFIIAHYSEFAPTGSEVRKSCKSKLRGKYYKVYQYAG